MCGIWSDSDDHLTTDPRTFLYSIFYSKKAAVEAYTPRPPTQALSHGPISIQQLYSSYTGCIAIQLYSSYTVYILYSIPLVTALSTAGRNHNVQCASRASSSSCAEAVAVTAL